MEVNLLPCTSRVGRPSFLPQTMPANDSLLGTTDDPLCPALHLKSSGTVFFPLRRLILITDFPRISALRLTCSGSVPGICSCRLGNKQGCGRKTRK